MRIKWCFSCRPKLPLFSGSNFKFVSFQNDGRLIMIIQ